MAGSGWDGPCQKGASLAVPPTALRASFFPCCVTRDVCQHGAQARADGCPLEVACSKAGPSLFVTWAGHTVWKKCAGGVFLCTRTDLLQLSTRDGSLSLVFLLCKHSLARGSATLSPIAGPIRREVFYWQSETVIDTGTNGPRKVPGTWAALKPNLICIQQLQEKRICSQLVNEI